MSSPLKLKLTAALLFCSFSLSLFSEISISSEPAGRGWTIEIANNSGRLFKAMVMSASSDFKPEPGEISVEPGKRATLEIKFLGDSDSGSKPVYIRLISDHEENPGLITPGEPFPSTAVPPSEEDSGGILLEYYYTPSCSSCRDFLDSEIPLMEKKLALAIDVRNINITEPEGLSAMNKRLKSLGSAEKKLPLLIAGNVILAGDKAIEAGLEPLLEDISGRKNQPVLKESISDNSGGLRLSVLPVLLAGLLDGINPCAFSTLIFLLSWLTLAGRDRRQILLTGVFFTATVFTTYYAIGLGAFTALRSSESVPVAAAVLRYSMALLMVILGIIHIVDYGKIRRGRSGDISLQLSRERKRKIHSLIRGKARQTGIFAGSIVLGILVTLYELGCTGQVYLPTLMYMVRIEKGVSSYLLLGAYNLAFIAPLIAVFTAAWKGTGSEKLTVWFRRNLGLVKILSALFFLLMAGLLILL